MGIVKITLENERGERAETLFDKTNCLAKLLPVEQDGEFPLSSGIDLYGNTVFNRLQMKDLLKELDLISANTADPDSKRFLTRIRDLAVRCRDEPHLYVKFYGD